MKKIITLLMSIAIIIQLFVPAILTEAANAPLSEDVNTQEAVDAMLSEDPATELDKLMDAQTDVHRWSVTPKTLDGKTGTNNNQVILNAWGAHSLKDNCDYYFIEMYGSLTATNSYGGPRNYGKDKIETGYLADAKISAKPLTDTPDEVVTLGPPSPDTQIGTGSISSSISKTITGGIMCCPSNPFQFNTAIGFNKTSSWSVSDLNVFKRDAVESSSSVRWDYEGRRTDSRYREDISVEVIPCANVCKSTMSPHSYWIWRFDPSMRDEKHEIKIDVDLDYIDSKCYMKSSGTETATNHYDCGDVSNESWVIELEKPPICEKKVTIDKPSAGILAGETVELTASGGGADSYTWKSSDESIATVDQNGVVKGISEGTAIITSTGREGTKIKGTAESYVHVIPETIPFTTTIAVGGAIITEYTGQGGHVDFPAYVYYHNAIYPVKEIGAIGATDKMPGAEKITSLTFLQGEQEKINSHAFYNCSNIKGSLILPKNLKLIRENAFSGCKFDGDLKIPDSVTAIEDSAFSGCSDFNGSLKIGSNVTTIGNSAFYNCSGLTGDLNIPDSVTTIGNSAFYNCSSFIGNLKMSGNVTKIGKQALQGCTEFNGIKALMVPDSVASGNVGDNAFKDLGGSSPIFAISMPNWWNSVKNKYGFNGTMVANRLFDYELCEYPDGRYVARITGYKGEKGAVEFPEVMIDEDSVKYPVKEIGSGKYATTMPGVANITSITLPEGLEKINDWAFAAATSLSGDIIIPDSVESIGDWAFSFLITHLGNLKIGNSVKSIGDYAFCPWSGSGSFTGSLIIPDSVESIGEAAFYTCGFDGGTLKIGSNVQTIGDGAFNYCKFTGNLTIPNSVTSIGAYAFGDCGGFTGDLVIPKSVTSIGNDAFYNLGGYSPTWTLHLPKWCDPNKYGFKGNVKYDQ